MWEPWSSESLAFLLEWWINNQNSCLLVSCPATNCTLYISQNKCHPDDSLCSFSSLPSSRSSWTTLSRAWPGWVTRWRPKYSASSPGWGNAHALTVTPTGRRFRRTSRGSARTRPVSRRSAVVLKASCRKTTLSASSRWDFQTVFKHSLHHCQPFHKVYKTISSIGI